MTEPSQFLDQPDLVADYLEPFRALIENTDGDFEKQVLIWSIIHYVALNQLDEKDRISNMGLRYCGRSDWIPYIIGT